MSTLRGIPSVGASMPKCRLLACAVLSVLLGASASALRAAETVSSVLADKLVSVKNGALVPAPGNRLKGAKYVAFYYAASWCAPCREFTPELLRAYKEIKARHPEFELIYVSDDKSPEAMTSYMAKSGMVWPAIRFDARPGLSPLRRPAYEIGLPNLVFVDARGRDLSATFKPDGEYVGPQEVLADIRRHFRM